MSFKPSRYTFVLLVATVALAAQQPTPQPTTAAQAPNRDTSYIDAQGTAHITRVVPVPSDLSPEAQKSIGHMVPDLPCCPDRPDRLDPPRRRYRVAGGRRGGDCASAPAPWADRWLRDLHRTAAHHW